MGKRKLLTSEDVSQSFCRHKSYSIDEIMAAGGTTAFAAKMGKNFQAIDNRLKKLPKDTFLTKDEANEALKILKESK